MISKYVTISLFITFNVFSTEYNPEEIDLAHIQEVEYSTENKVEKYTAYLGPTKGNDSIFACKNLITGKYNCWRVCKNPENRTLLPASYFDQIKTKYKDQKTNKN